MQHDVVVKIRHGGSDGTHGYTTRVQTCETEGLAWALAQGWALVGLCDRANGQIIPAHRIEVIRVKTTAAPKEQQMTKRQLQTSGTCPPLGNNTSTRKPPARKPKR